MKPLLAYLSVILAVFASLWYIFTAVTLWTLISAVSALAACVAIVVYKIKRL